MRAIQVSIQCTLLSILCCVSAMAQSCSIATSVLSQASGIRGLKIRKAVPCLLEEREQVKKFVLGAVDTKLPPKRLQYEGAVYQIIGLIPEDYEYEKGLVELYVSQIGGYYDPAKKRYIMAAWLPDMMQPSIAAHELTHALQDQYYDLESMTAFDKFSGDELLARSSLIEGDATAVMYDFSRKLVNLPGMRAEKDVNSILMQNALGISLISGMGNVPQSLQMIMLFPYSSGLRFVHHFLRQGGYQKIDSIFKQPPSSSEEILHPEKYGRSTAEFRKVSRDEIKDSEIPDGFELVYDDVMGEFVLSVLFGQQIKDADTATKAAGGWGGDRLGLWQKSGSKESYLSWRLAWDSVKDRDEFVRALGLLFEKRFGISLPSCGGPLRNLPSHSAGALYAFRCEMLPSEISLLFKRAG